MFYLRFITSVLLFVAGLSDTESHLKRAMILSFDGLHATDLQTLANDPESYPNFAYFITHGTTYPRYRVTTPADSFPGLSSVVTGKINKIFPHILTNNFRWRSWYDRSVV